MYRIRKLLFISLALFVMPITVFASSSVDKNSINIFVNTNDTFTVNVSENSATVRVSSNNTSVASVDISEQTVNNSSLVVTVTGVQKGNTTINISVDYEDESIEDENYTVPVTVNEALKSTNNNLSDIKIDGTSLSDFSPSKTTYDYNTTNSSVTISASLADEKANLSISGPKNLSVGTNIYELIVTAEAGNTKKYTVRVIRTQNKDTNNYLSSLAVDKENLTLKKDEFVYNVEVESSVNKVTISATAESEKSKVEGKGLKNLKYGENKFEVKVTSESGSARIYTINVKRKDDRDTNNNLLNLKLDKEELVFNKETLTYNISVDYEITSLVVTATPESEKATVSGDGEVKLNVGTNKVEVKVTAENESVKTYVINIVRLEEAAERIKYIKSLSIEELNLYFNQDVTEYNITLDELGENSQLTFDYELEEDVTAELKGNENLELGSVITLTVTKGENSRAYAFNIIENEESSVTTDSKNGKSKYIWLMIIGLTLTLFGVVGSVTKVTEKKKKLEEANNYQVDLKDDIEMFDESENKK